MKIRTGFVSNSSSSSFLIWGCTVKQSEFDLPEDMDSYEFIDTNSDLMQCAGPNDDVFFYIGRCPSECGGEETMNQFKARTEAEVKQFLKKYNLDPDSVKFGWQSEAWYDG